jgi:hypothetical protein
MDTIEAVLFLKEGVQVLGSGPAASVLDAGGTSTVVVADHCGPGTSLTGLTLRNGGLGSSAGFDFGDGIFVNGGSPFLVDLEIESVEGGFGAVDIFGPATPILMGLLVRDNGQVAPLSAPVLVSQGAWVELQSTVIRNNHGDSAGGLAILNAEISATNCVVAGNLGVGGGGIRMVGAIESSIQSSTVVANISAEAGAGIRLESSSARISDCLIVSNVSLTGQTGGVHSDAASQLILEHNDAFGNLDTDYQSRSDPTGSDGNISADPLFRDFSTMDLRLREGSPAIDAGSPSGPSVDASDVLRPLDGDRDGTSKSDMGAFEFNRWDVPGVSIQVPPFRLSWIEIPEASGYLIYRGSIEDLAEDDFGNCLTTAGALTGGIFEDPMVPPIGLAWFYEITALVEGTEGTLGYSSFGLERIPQPGASCP